ncbi:hypothetical protein JRI60_01690 [Archangium violaceum]|uniref:imm11 family protein n=1 Tax=Archangium violaceum TaxID=83451 RepID=UPI00194F54BD|nr:DUF1629 domain-containing protein [Archangium violaceum]QRO02336.1 hypothetical protein JRI60_01690 [Archangium violaceum]
MSRFFDLVDDRSARPRWHLGLIQDERGRELNPWQFEKGKWLELGCVPRFPLQIPGPPLDFTWAGLSIPVVHARFVQVFERLSLLQEVQFIPAQVEGHPGPYFILNALRIIPCIDDARCEEVRYWKPEDGRPDKVGEYRAVHGLKVDPARVGDAHIFRPWGWRVALIVSEELKEALEREALTGTRFIEA